MKPIAAALSMYALRVHAAAQSDAAVEVYLSHKIAASPAKVWAAVGDPGLAMLVPLFVAKVDVVGSGVGAERTLHLPGGDGAVKERIIARDDGSMTYSYAIVDFGPVPWLECIGTWSVHLTAMGHSIVTYSARIVPRDPAAKEEAKAISAANQQALFVRLEQLFAPQSH